MIGLVALETAPPAQAALKGSMFDPGLIISDSVFYDFGTMTVDEIQRFLDSKVEVCGATTGPTCLRYYKMDTQAKAASDGRCDAIPAAKNQSAAQIIFTVANACHINPRVLIVTLQKEQGLVQAARPTAYMYRAAVGYGCPDSKPQICGKDSKITGLFNQLYWAAGQFQWYGDSRGSFTYLKVGTNISMRYHPDACTVKNTDGTCGKWVNQCGNATFQLKSQATAALYYYTPYTPNAKALTNLYGTGDNCSAYGNRNFWRFYTDWFGSTVGGGFLLKSANSGTYLIVDDKKYLVNDSALVNSLGPLGPLGTVSQPYLDSFNDAGELTPLVQSATKKYFMIADGKKFAISSCNAAAGLGLDCTKAVTLTNNQLAALPTGGTATALVTETSGARYLITNGQIHQILDDASLASAHITLPAPSGISLDAFGYLPWGAPIANDLTLLTDSKTGQLGIYITGAFYRIDAQTAKDIDFTKWFTNSGASLTPAGLSAVETAVTVTPFVAGADGNRWLLTSDGKISISSTSPLVSSVTELDAKVLNAITTAVGQYGAPALVQRTSGPKVTYYVQQDSARQLGSSMDKTILSDTLAQPSVLLLSDAAFSELKLGQPVFAPGSVVKSSKDGSLYAVRDFSTLIPMPDENALADLGLESHKVKPEYIAGYKQTQKFKGLVYLCDGQRYVASDGLSLPIDDTAVNSYPKSATHLGDALCSNTQISLDQTAGRFIHVIETNQYYLIDGGKKRLILSKRAYQKLASGLTRAYDVHSWFANRLFTGSEAPAKLTTSTPVDTPTTTQTKYTVKSGDTLGGIASRYKVTLAALMAANSITNANSIKVGQVLIIPKS